jgi:hypothetical protein
MLLSQDIKKAAGDLFNTAMVEGRTHSILIDEQESVTVNQLDEIITGKQVAVYIGLSAADSSNCELMSRTIQQSHVEPWENHFFTKPIANNELNRRLRDIGSACTRYDHLLVYISATDAKSRSISKNKMVGIIPQANKLIELIFQANPGGLTVIYDGLLEAAPNIGQWLSDGKALHISPQGSQPVKKSKKSPGTYTAILCEAISGLSILHTHRQLYATIVNQYNNSGSSSKDPAPPVNSPVLICNRATCGFPFSGNAGIQLKVQQGLRLLGRVQATEHTNWTSWDQAALIQYSNEKKITPDFNHAIAAIETDLAELQKETRPIFLFVFSDPNRQLKTIEREIKLISDTLLQSDFATSVDIRIMHNRTLGELDRFVLDAGNRNRIQLFYYSGFDREGMAVFADDELTIRRWTEWLGYHAQLELVVFNTCRAALIAEQLTQLGVGLAIGAFGEITDDYGGYFADLFVNVLLAQRPFDTLPFSSIEYRS